MKIRFGQTFKYISVFAVGAVLYPILEILWRGYTHPSMAVVGGICFCGIWFVNEKLMYRYGTVFRALLCSGIITAVELCSGILLNTVLGLRVWDYSMRPFNFMGQICIGYTFLWFALSIPVSAICARIISRMHGGERAEDVGNGFSDK